MIKYVGNFFEGKMQGKGKLFWSNNDVMDGDFSCDWFTGTGKLITTKNNKKMIHSGTFENGLAHGNGVRRYSDGQVAKGHFREGKGQGGYLIVYPTGDSYCGLKK
mmetsp:Transcript_4820/g.3305  ORF Transcript_4820/g.3305 Transcript_4820/m.3305 type:complete len:105 (+) Transcript_4820:528-842(+)